MSGPFPLRASAPAFSGLDAPSLDLRGPARVASDAAGRLLIADTPADRVVVLDAFGRLVSQKTGLAGPLGIGGDSAGNVYVGEQACGRVSVFDSQWNLLHHLGAGSNEFRLPNYIALDERDGSLTVWVSDGLGDELRTYSGGVLTGRIGTRGSGPGQFNAPAGLWISPAGEVFVVDQNNERVQVLNRAGVYQRAFSLRPPGVRTRSGRAQGLAGDAAGRLYVADTFQGYISVFDTNGTFLGGLGGYGSGPGQLRSPAGVTVDASGRLFVAAINNHRVESFGLDCFTQLTASPARQFVPVGTTVTLSAHPSCGTAISYQWRKDGVDLSDGGSVAGARTSTLTLMGVTAAEAGLYSVQILADGTPAVSPAAVVAVLAPPVITAPPASQSVPLGSTVTLGVVATGQELEYQWLFNGVPLAVPSQPTLEIRGASVAAEGDYQAVVFNGAGAVTSAVAHLTVMRPPTFVMQPTGQTVPEGGGATLAVAASGSGPLTYVWLRDGTPLSGATGSSLTLTNLIPPQSGAYQAVAANAAGAVTSQVAVLVVVPDTVAPQLVSVAGGKATNLTLTASFTKRLDPNSAQSPAHYTVLGPGAPSVVGATLSQGTNVVLTLSGPRVPYQNYALRVQDLTDTAYTPNVLSPNPSTAPVSAQIELVTMYETTWRYLEPTNNVLDSQPWQLAGFDDRPWRTGQGIFYGHRTNSVYQPDPNPNVHLPLVVNASDPSNYLAHTILNVFTNAGNAIQTVTYYFRTEFVFPAATNGASLLFRAAIDDGGVFWLNGQELRRERMPGGPVTYTNFASGDGKQEWAPKLTDPPRALAPVGLRPGTNVLAVEVHQRNGTDPDVTLGVWLEALVLNFLEPAPALAIRRVVGPVRGAHGGISPGGSYVISWEAPGWRLESAPDVSGPWTPIAESSPCHVFDPASPARFFRLSKTE